MISTGLRESKCAAKLTIYMSERKGVVIVRSGKGEKYRGAAQRNVRRAIQAYLEVRPNRGIIFVSNKSERLSESQLYRIIRKYAIWPV